MKGVLVRLAGSLLGVFAFWVVIWLPLVLTQTSAAEPGEQAMGDPNAPVTVIEYASLTCPHCAQFHTEVLPDLKERYIATGKVRMIYRDFPLDERALTAASPPRQVRMAPAWASPTPACPTRRRRWAS